MRRHRPTPVDEARAGKAICYTLHKVFTSLIFPGFFIAFCSPCIGLHIVEQSLWKAVPHYLRRVSTSLKKVLFLHVHSMH